MKAVAKLLAVALVLTSAAGLAQQAGQPSKAKYIGADKCKMCHPDEHKTWGRTTHSKAFDLLKIVGEEKNEMCLACHVTGFGKGGYVDQASTSNLSGVQCESCHGPGGDHNGDKTKIVRSPSATVCAACHQEMNIHAIH
jgi:predicted CXXCH cytochrome family protein